MKTRLDYVTNSSSVSFILNKSDLTELQISQIRDHIKYGNELLALPVSYLDDEPVPYQHDDGYTISENDATISGHIDCDWFPMDRFFDLIGVKEELIQWENDTDHWDRYPRTKDYLRISKWMI